MPPKGSAKPKAPARKKAGPSQAEKLAKELGRMEAQLGASQARVELLQAKLEVMHEVTRVSSGHFSQSEILELFLDIVLKTTHTEAGSILMVDPTGRVLTFEAVRGPKAEEVKKFRIAVGEGIAGWVAETGQSVKTDAATKDRRFTPRIAKAVAYIPQNILCVALKGKDGVLGVLELINRADGRFFTDDDLAQLESLAAQISTVIENAQLFSLHRSEIEKLSKLIQVSEAINSTLDLKKLLKLVMESAASILRAEASSILMIEEETGDLLFEIATGEKGDQMKLIRVPMGEGIAGWVAKEGKSLLVADVTKDPRFYKKADEKSKFVTKSIAAVPLKARGKTIGVVETLNKMGGGEFSPDDVRVLEALAHQSAIAIENARLYQNLQDSFLATVTSLAAAIDAKDPYTAGHSSRVTEYAVTIANELKVPAAEVDAVRLAGLMHDVGKIGIPESILGKPGKLTDEEFAAMKKHPTVGALIITPIRQLRHVIPGVKMHHERMDGRGYPDGLKGEQISLAGRILSVADAFDAMTSDRPYRRRLSDEIAVAELEKGCGGQFDEKIVRAFLIAYGRGDIKTVPSTMPE